MPRRPDAVQFVFDHHPREALFVTDPLLRYIERLEIELDAMYAAHRDHCAGLGVGAVPLVPETRREMGVDAPDFGPTLGERRTLAAL